MKDKAYWKNQAHYLAAMLALVPVGQIILPEEDDMDLAFDILAQFPSPKNEGIPD